MNRDPLAPIAARLRMAPGALYTVTVGLVFSMTLTLTGPPAAFSERRLVPSNGGLGQLASPAEPTAPPTSQPVEAGSETQPIVPSPDASTPRVTPPAPPVGDGAPPDPLDGGPELGAVLARAEIPGAIMGVAAIADGAVATVDRDDVAPLIIRVSDHGEVVGSVALTGRDVSGDVDIAGLLVDTAGALLVLVSGPHEVVRVGTDGETVEALGAIPDVLPCALSLPIPVPCEPGLENREPQPADIARVGDEVLVSDPGQGIMWSIDADGATTVAASDAAYAADEHGPGLRGLAARDESSVVATIDATVVEFDLGSDDQTARVVADLPEPAVALDTDRSGELMVLLETGDLARYDRSTSELPHIPSAGRGGTALALTSDHVWVARDRGHPAGSLLTRLALTGRSS